MGVSTNFYTIYGIKLEFNEEFVKVWDDAYNDADTPNVIVDCMCDEYIIIGDILFDSGDYRYGFEDGDTCKIYDVNTIIEKGEKYKTAFVAKFPEFKDLVDKPFEIISVVHFS